MPAPTPIPTLPPPSALTTLITSTLTASEDPNTTHTSITHQVLHNLQHQHLWTSLKIHNLEATFPATLISGIPPHRVYTHPDEQLYMVERGLREEDVELDRMFVLPTVQGQSFSLGKMAAVFDALPGPGEEYGEVAEGEAGSTEEEGEQAEEEKLDAEKAAKLKEYYDYRVKARKTEEWGGKRLLLAMIDKGMGGEGTVVYYVVHEGTVKPRQN
ncbi:hypothetical protein BJY04DRAFT_63379 [Aspergillus karnatakaensis]|uniref:uncharacterized protein n=1 Tax=Aspergillus karnatakaensis TaxID=1810916 RepID=UPI003CCDB040